MMVGPHQVDQKGKSGPVPCRLALVSFVTKKQMAFSMQVGPYQLYQKRTHGLCPADWPLAALSERNKWPFPCRLALCCVCADWQR